MQNEVFFCRGKNKQRTDEMYTSKNKEEACTLPEQRRDAHEPHLNDGGAREHVFVLLVNRVGARENAFKMHDKGKVSSGA